jgi:hypothetical protein
MYSLVYDGESETYNFPLLDDMENGELRIVPLDSEFIELLINYGLQKKYNLQEIYKTLKYPTNEA